MASQPVPQFRPLLPPVAVSVEGRSKMDESTIDNLVDARREKRLAWVNRLTDQDQKKA